MTSSKEVLTSLGRLVGGFPLLAKKIAEFRILMSPVCWDLPICPHFNVQNPIPYQCTHFNRRHIRRIFLHWDSAAHGLRLRVLVFRSLGPVQQMKVSFSAAMKVFRVFCFCFTQSFGWELEALSSLFSFPFSPGQSEAPKQLYYTS